MQISHDNNLEKWCFDGVARKCTRTQSKVNYNLSSAKTSQYKIPAYTSYIHVTSASLFKGTILNTETNHLPYRMYFCVDFVFAQIVNWNIVLPYVYKWRSVHFHLSQCAWHADLSTQAELTIALICICTQDICMVWF